MTVEYVRVHLIGKNTNCSLAWHMTRKIFLFLQWYMLCALEQRDLSISLLKPGNSMLSQCVAQS